MKLTGKDVPPLITLFYVAVGAALFLSGFLLRWLIADSELLSTLQSVTGVVLLVLAGLLILFSLSSYSGRSHRAREAGWPAKKHRWKMGKKTEHYLSEITTIFYVWRIEDKPLFPIWISGNIETLLGYSPKEIKDFSWWEKNIHPEDRERVLAIFAELLEKGALTINYRFYRKDGTWVWFQNSMKLIEEGTALAGSWSDITEIKQQEESLRRQTNKLEMLYDFSRRTRAVVKTSELMEILTEAMHHWFSLDNVLVALSSPERETCTIEAGSGLFDGMTGEIADDERCVLRDVIRENKPYLTEDYSAEPYRVFDDIKEHIGPLACVPFKSEEEDFQGVLLIARKKKELASPFSQSDVQFLSAIGELIGNTLRRIKLFESLHQEFRKTQALRNIDMAITGSLDLRVTFRVILDETAKQLDVDAAAILLMCPDLQTLKFEAWRGFKTAVPEGVILKSGEGYAGKAASERRTLQRSKEEAQDSESEEDRLMEKEDFADCIALPLVAKGQVQGVLEIFSSESFFDRSDEWRDFLETIAGQAAVAIDNAEMFHDMESSNRELIEAYDSTIAGWAHALDLRDKETEDHSRRVAEMTVNIARKMGMSQEDLVHVRRGALLHDIGKMGVPDTILLKPGQLTKKEWAIMHRHPIHALEMLSPIEYLRPAQDIPYCHHERWDGTGYPRGLKRETIPLAARIFAVVDVYDALTTDRPYRKAWDSEDALRHIRQEGGRHFDPQVVEMFFREVKR